MKEFKITEEQIKKNKNLTLKEYFKEVFETKLEVGKWYKDNFGEGLYFITEIQEHYFYYYGFNYSFNYKEKDYYAIKNCDLVLATEKEVFNALKKEAEKRYKLGQTVRCLKDGEIETINQIDYDFYFDYSRLWINEDCKIFDNGKWAEIISQPDEVIELNGVKYKRIY